MKFVFTMFFIIICSVSYASQKAITDIGEEVILNDDGTWEYTSNSNQEKNEITTNKDIFQKPESSTFLLKSARNKSAYWIDSKKWNFKKATNNSEAEYEFQLKGGDLWGISISEGVTMPIETLVGIALENARAAAPDMKIIRQEYRMVNEIRVLYMEMKGTLQGINFTYLGYYYSDNSGSTQFLTYTGSSLVNKYKSEISDFLNGFVTQ